jgi:hypothetical protein
MIAFEIGDTVRVLVTIADSGAETMDAELVYRADELDFIEAEHRRTDDIGRDLRDRR